MKSIRIHGSKDSYFVPDIHFDAETGICHISGESYLENPREFYSPLIDWLNEYLSDKGSLELDIKLTYFNTSSSRFLFKIITTLKNAVDKGAHVTVKWHYYDDDEEMLEEIEDFESQSNLEILKVPFNDDDAS